MKVVDFYTKISWALRNLTYPGEGVKVEALVDRGDGIDRAAEVIDIVYDKDGDKLVIYVKDYSQC